MGLTVGAATWLGAKSQGLDLDLGAMVLAGANAVPAALLALAIGAVTFAVAPRLAPGAVYLVVGWSLIIDLVGSLVTSLHGLTRLSLFHYVAYVPAEDPNWTALAVMTLVAGAAMAGALVAFDRRDLATD